jgi:hypothetical protein
MFHPMMLWALGGRLQRRKILACSILLVVLACAALPGVSEASRKIRGSGFSTIVPSGWKVDRGKAGTSRFYSASSPQTKPNVTINSMQLSVNVIPVTDFERQLGRKIPSSLEEVLGEVMSAPQQAQNVQITATFRPARLDGRPAASGAVQFFLGGTTLLQSETVSIYRGRVYILVFYADTAQQYQGLLTLRRVHSHWRWR